MTETPYWEVVLAKVREQDAAVAEERRIDDRHLGLVANVLSAAILYSKAFDEVDFYGMKQYCAELRSAVGAYQTARGKL